MGVTDGKESHNLNNLRFWELKTIDNSLILGSLFFEFNILAILDNRLRETHMGVFGENCRLLIKILNRFILDV